MQIRFGFKEVSLLAAVFALATPFLCAAQSGAPADLQWVRVNDERLQWLNVGDWEPRGDGLQPVRVPKVWRDKWPARTANRAQSAAGVTARFRTDSKKLVFRVTFVDVTDTPGTPEATWERSRPSYFDLYRASKYIASIAAATKFTQQDVILYNDPELSGEAEIEVLFPFYYRNAEVIVHGIGIDPTSKLVRAAPDTRRRVLFHGDSITHGHGVTSPRETYVWQACERADCISLNYGFGGTAWADNIVAETIASRTDWDVLIIALGTNSFGGLDSAGKPETAAQYGEKYSRFLSTIRDKAPNKPILSMTPILNRLDLKPTKNKNGEIPKDYRNAITQVVRQHQASDRNLHLLDGLQLINDPLYLWVTDVVHPNDAGSQRMADGVASALKPLLKGLLRGP
jgi:lysophospholipase L1-like esterase